MASDWKDRLGVVFSTNPDFAYNTAKEAEAVTLDPSKQNLKIWLDRLKGGRVATVVRGFVVARTTSRSWARSLRRVVAWAARLRMARLSSRATTATALWSCLPRRDTNVKRQVDSLYIRTLCQCV